MKNKLFTSFITSLEVLFNLNIWFQLYIEPKYRYIDVDFFLHPELLPLTHAYTEATTSFDTGVFTPSASFQKRYQINNKKQIFYLKLFALNLMAYLNAKNGLN